MGEGEDLIHSSMELLEATRAQIGAGRAHGMSIENVLRQTLQAIASSEASIMETDRAMRRWWYCSGQSPPLTSTAPTHDEERHERG